MTYLPYGEFLRSLPRKRMAAGALIRDEQGRILLVKPVYKGGWSLPGGVVEADESPKTACIRDIREELGMDQAIGRMLVVDYTPSYGEKTESLMFIYDGGVVESADLACIHLQAEEIEDYGLFAARELPKAMSRSLRRRILAAWEQLGEGGGIYLEDQEKVE